MLWNIFTKLQKNFTRTLFTVRGILISAKNGINKDGSYLKRFFHDINNVENVELMSNDLNFRFNESKNFYGSRKFGQKQSIERKQKLHRTS
ncbi:MAG: hypothetical protein IK062_02520 [Selenomonadaceae bacterium]|nr:hypothetical protein [Selenomonadaceae bacterium]